MDEIKFYNIIDMKGNKIQGAGAAVEAADVVIKSQLDALEASVAAGIIYRGLFDASAGNFTAIDNASQGDLYKISVAGTVGGIDLQVGDVIIVNKDCTDVLQVETAAITVGSVVAGTITVTVTGTNIGNSPKAIELEVAEGDLASDVAGKIKTALAVADITTNYDVGGTGANVTLTAKVAAANVTNLNIALADTDTTGVNAIVSSTNTTAGRTSVPMAADIDKIDNTEDPNIVRLAAEQTLTNKTINADNNTISNLEVDNLKSGVLDTELSSVSSSDDTIPSAKAVKTFVDNKKFIATITGDGSAKNFIINHAKNTKDVIVQVREDATNQVVYPTIEMTDADNITVKFSQGSKPADDELFKVVILL